MRTMNIPTGQEMAVAFLMNLNTLTDTQDPVSMVETNQSYVFLAWWACV